MFKESLKIIGALIVAFAILFIFSRFSIGNRTAPSSKDHTQLQAQVISSENNQSNTYPVVRVVDGDTLVVNIDGDDQTIRLIGVNTPETVDPKKPVECFGREASNFLKTMLPPGTLVRLEADSTQDDKDKYGRLLRYVYLGDVLVEGELIQDGYGFEYTYDKPYKYQTEFKASENYARAGFIGLWATSTCSGQLKKA